MSPFMHPFTSSSMRLLGFMHSFTLLTIGVSGVVGYWISLSLLFTALQAISR